MEKDRKMQARAKNALLMAALLLILLSLPEAAYAEAVTIISGDYYTDDTFMLNDRIGIINVDSYEQVILDYDNNFIVIDNATCRRVVNDNFCVTSIEYDIGKEEKKASLSISYLGPTVEPTDSMNISDPKIGEGTKVIAKMENIGNTTAKNVTYINIIPPEIKAFKIRGSPVKIEKFLTWANDTGKLQNMTKVSWTGEIAVSETRTLEYGLKPLKYVDTTFAAKVIYNDGRKKIEDASSALSMKTKSFFELTKKFAPLDYSVPAESITLTSGESKSDLYVGEEMLFITEIKNKALKNETINITYIDFYVPDSFIYKGPMSFVVYTNKSDANASYTPGIHTLEKAAKGVYRWKGLINPDGIVFCLKLKGAREGKSRVAVSAKFIQLEEKKGPVYKSLYEQDYDGYEEIDIKLKDPTIESNFKDGQTFDSAEKRYFTLYMQNPNDYTNFTKLNVTLETPWLTKNFTLTRVKVNNYINLFDGFVEMPVVTSPTTGRIKANVTYETEYGETDSVKFERSISIKPHSPVKPSYYLSPSKSSSTDGAVIGNEEIMVTVKLTNFGNSDIKHINLTQETDPALTGDSNFSRTINIDKGITMDALMYKINPPDISPLKEYKLITRLDYVAANDTYHLVKEYRVEVNDKKLGLTVTKKIQVDKATIGFPFYADYLVENTNKEPINNVTLIFPLSNEFDLVGSRYYTISRIEKGGSASAIAKEKLVSKKNGTGIKLPKTDIVFHDESGNEFRANSSDDNLEVIYITPQSPLIMLTRNISKTTVNQTEKFLVYTALANIGGQGAKVTLSDFGKAWELDLDKGRNKTLQYEVSENRIGEILLEPAIANYTYNNEIYYSSSNKNLVNVVGIVEEEPEEKPAEKEPEVVGGEVVTEERPPNPYYKYMYLTVFVILVCIILFSVIRMKPKEKRFKFMEE